MAYRAEIEIGVRGARQLRDVTNQVKTLAERVDLISANFKPFIQTLGQFESNLNRTATTLKRVRAGTEDEVQAIKQYVQALGQANSARARQNNLIQQEIALQEAAKRKIQPGPTGFSRAQFGPALPPAFIKQQENQQNFKALFAELNETAKAISVSNTNTKTSWQKTFQELNETAKAISVSRLNTQTSWGETFKQLNETAKAIAVSRLNTQSSWQQTFKELNETAKAISVSRLNTQTSWQKALSELKETSNVISLGRLETQNSWKQAFKQLDETAELIRQNSARVALREQRRSISVKEAISKGRSGRIQRERSAFLLGAEQPGGPQGPLRGPGGTGFPVALPLTKAEQKAADLNKRYVTLRDTAAKVVTQTKLQLSLVEQLGPAYKALTAEFNRQLEIQKQSGKLTGQFSPIGGSESIPGSPAFLRARSRRRRDAASNALIGGAFPLLFGQGAGAALGGGLGGGLGGLAGGQFGFGLSLVGTAAGQAIDTLIAKAADLGKALDKTSLDIEAVTKAAGEVSKQAQTLIEETKEVAGAEAAAAAAASLLATQIGQDGVTALTNFADANKELDASVSVLISNLSILAATLLGPVVKGVAGLIQRANLAEQTQRIREEGGPDAERLRAAFKRGAAEGGTVDAGNLAQQQEAAKILAERRQEVLNKVEQTNLENSKALPILEKQGEILKLKGGLLNENIYLKKKEIIELEYAAKLNKENLTTLQKKKIEQERTNALQQLSNDKAAEAARAAEKARRANEKAERERKQRQNQLLSAQAAELASVNNSMRVDLQRTKVVEGDLAALEQRKTQLRAVLNNNLEILKVRQKQRVQNVKSVEEAKVLHEAYLNQYRALVSQEETEAALVGLAIKRLQLAREQEKIDADRARRSQLEAVQQESFGFTAQLADPFNLNSERVIAAEAELRTSQILRGEREKLADLERERAAISSFASAEAVNKLTEQIDAQRAFIPQLEAELALRNQLELAAARQSVIIEKYGFLANELSTAMSSAVQAVVTGTGTVEEAFSTMFANIGKAFIDMATQMLAQKLFMTVLSALGGGGGGFSFSGGSASSGLSAANLMGGAGPLNAGMFGFGRANGGPVSPGSTYLVGERGPELLTMGPSGGYVTSNSASQAAMDRYSSGNSRGGSISVNYNVTDINGMRFVTEDQFRAGVAQAAKQGADGGFNRTMSSLKNNRSTRSRIGV